MLRTIHDFVLSVIFPTLSQPFFFTISRNLYNTSRNPANNSPHENYPSANRNLCDPTGKKSDISTQFASILSINNSLHAGWNGNYRSLNDRLGKVVELSASNSMLVAFRIQLNQFSISLFSLLFRKNLYGSCKT